MTSRNFLFVLNNYSEEEINTVKDYFTENCKYGIFGKEVGKQGTPHLQGFMILNKPAKLSGVIKGFTKRAHIEKCLGSARQNYDYCGKEGLIFEWGNAKLLGAGKRSDLLEVLKDPKSVVQTRPDLYVKYHRGIEKLIQKEDIKTLNAFLASMFCNVIIGLPGTGKTRYVMEKHGSENVFKIDSIEGTL